MITARAGGVDLDDGTVFGIDKIPVDATDFDNRPLQRCATGFACKLHADPVHLAIAPVEDDAVVGGAEEGKGMEVQEEEERE